MTHTHDLTEEKTSSECLSVFWRVAHHMTDSPTKALPPGAAVASQWLEAKCAHVTLPLTVGDVTLQPAECTVFLTGSSAQPKNAAPHLLEPWRSAWRAGLLELWKHADLESLRPPSGLGDDNALVGLKAALESCGFKLETRNMTHTYTLPPTHPPTPRASVWTFASWAAGAAGNRVQQS
jgi:hypothetical protein